MGQHIVDPASGPSGIIPYTTFAVWGDSKSGTAVAGTSQESTGVVGNSMTATGVVGTSDHGRIDPPTFNEEPAEAGSGVYGINSATNGIGVIGYGGTRSYAVGVSGFTYDGTGVTGKTIAGYGVSGFGEVGLLAQNTTGAPGQQPVVYLATRDLAGDLQGDVNVHGTLTKSGGAFQIDHPLDPANKYLAHSFVESPDMKNVYDGLVVLDEEGAATMELPPWFEALNGVFRYQLTAIGSAAPDLHVTREVSDGSFSIGGGRPNMTVSWQVTGIRHDKWANAHRILVEQEKPLRERGYFLHPALHGAPAERSVERARYHSSGVGDADPLVEDAFTAKAQVTYSIPPLTGAGGGA